MTDVQEKLGETAADLASQASKMQAIINSTDTPTLEAPPSPAVNLIIGVDVDGVHYGTAVVREITGADEEELSSVERADDGDGYSFLLEAATTALRARDGSEIEAKPHIKELTIGDRDTLFLAIIKATYGDTRLIGCVCPHCDATLDVAMVLSEEFEVIPVPEGMRADGTIPLTLRNGAVAEVRFPTGALQSRAWASVVDKENIPMYNTALIAECLVSLSGSPMPDAARHIWARQLGLADRRILFEAIEKAPGPRIATITTDCGECSKPIVVRLDWGRLLYG